MVQIRTKKKDKIFANDLFVSDFVGTKKVNDDVLGYKSNIEGEVTASVAVCSLNIPMMYVADDNDEEGANEASNICEISHEEEMVNDDHDDRVKTAILAVCEVTPKSKKDKVHCVEVIEPVYEFSENIDDFNFVEEFDKIVEDCIEVAANEIDKVQAK